MECICIWVLTISLIPRNRLNKKKLFRKIIHKFFFNSHWGFTTFVNRITHKKVCKSLYFSTNIVSNLIDYLTSIFCFFFFCKDLFVHFHLSDKNLQTYNKILRTFFCIFTNIYEQMFGKEQSAHSVTML